MRLFYPGSSTSSGDYIVTYVPVTIPATQHSGVCSSQPPVYGRCPRYAFEPDSKSYVEAAWHLTVCFCRYVFESVGNLLVSKLVFNAFVSPLLTVVLCLPWAIRAQEWFMKALLRRSKYSVQLSMDIELAQALVQLVVALSLGVAVSVLMARARKAR